MGRIAPDRDLTAPQVRALRDSWRRHSLASGWLTAGDWHSAAVDEVCQAVAQPAAADPPDSAAGPGLRAACCTLGRDRARAGISIVETLTDLAALYAALGRGGPDLVMLCAAADGWADDGLARHVGGGCEDPLTGLTTMAYLRTRMTEVYREAAAHGTNPAQTHRLVAVRLPAKPDPWRRLASSILLGRDLRAAFPGGDTLSQVPGPGTGIALIKADGNLPARYASLRRTLRGRCGAQTRMTSLPAVLDEALRLLDRLAH